MSVHWLMVDSNRRPWIAAMIVASSCLYQVCHCYCCSCPRCCGWSYISDAPILLVLLLSLRYPNSHCLPGTGFQKAWGHHPHICFQLRLLVSLPCFTKVIPNGLEGSTRKDICAEGNIFVKDFAILQPPRLPSHHLTFPALFC